MLMHFINKKYSISYVFTYIHIKKLIPSQTHLLPHLIAFKAKRDGHHSARWPDERATSAKLIPLYGSKRTSYHPGLGCCLFC